MWEAGHPDATRLNDHDRADALGSLRHALGWRMTRQRWDGVRRIVDAMSAALAGGDVEGFRSAAAEMLLAGPKRITRIGDTPTEPPDKIRERVNELIHVLVEVPASECEPPDRGQRPNPPNPI
jgi:hypothetical protein